MPAHWSRNIYEMASNITTMGNAVFLGCSGLTNVVLGNSITSIAQQTFSYCSGLTTLVIPNNVSSIGSSAFYRCSGLINIIIPNGVTSIGSGAFYNCLGLTSITIPGSVADIGQNAFTSCANLHQVFFQGNAPTVNGSAGSVDNTVFSGESGTVYFLPGTTGWGGTFGGWPTAQWYQAQPQILGSDFGLNLQHNQFSFTVSWATNTSVVVEGSTNLQNWAPVITNTLVSGTNYFSDSDYTNFPQRFYRVRSQ